MTLAWTWSYPNSPMTTELYGLFAFVGLVVGSSIEWLLGRAGGRGDREDRGE
jgi:hypothetical protein